MNIQLLDIIIQTLMIHYNATVAVHFVMHWLHSIMCIVYRLLVLGNFYEEYFMKKKQKLNSFFYLLVFPNANVEGPPHLVLGDAPHLTCLDTQTSEDLSAYFPQTPYFLSHCMGNFLSHCMGTTSDLARPSRPAMEKLGGMSSTRLSTCRWSKRMPSDLRCILTQIFFSMFILSLF